MYTTTKDKISSQIIRKRQTLFQSAQVLQTGLKILIKLNSSVEFQGNHYVKCTWLEHIFFSVNYAMSKTGV